MEKNSSKIIRIICVIICAVFIFLSGFLVAKFARSAASRSLDWIIKTINENYYKDVEEEKIVKYALSGGLDKLLDVYSDYYTAEEYKALLADNAGSKTGVGISYTFVEGKGVLINSVVGNSPAYISGLRKGLFIEYGINGKGEKTAFNAIEDFSKFAAATADNEKITLHASDGKDYTMAKDSYTASYAYMCTNSSSWTFKSSADNGLALYENNVDKMEFLPQGAAYMCLSQFYGTAAEEIRLLIEKFNELNCSSLILDLRENGGGYVEVMQNISYSFTGNYQNDYNSVAMYAEYKNGKKTYFDIRKCEKEYVLASDVEVYVMANADTASASEALIGVLISYGVIDYSNIYLTDYSDEYISWLSSSGYAVKDKQTYGKGIMQSTFRNFITGEALKLTTAKIYWPNGTCIHDVGLTESVGCNTVYAEWSVTYEDGELKRAVNEIYN